jgi:hypothetical protein
MFVVEWTKLKMINLVSTFSTQCLTEDYVILFCKRQELIQTDKA